jgi:hypothetical protein
MCTFVAVQAELADKFVLLRYGHDTQLRECPSVTVI